MAKTVLFVTYGGGHAPMVAPVLRALESTSGIHTRTLALTLAGPYFKRQGLPYLGFKDFITAQDAKALDWGKKLAAQQHQPETGIEEEEAVAYLGLSYWDLVTRLGDAEAARLWESQGRNAFLPLTVLRRIIERIQPDMVVTTNSPRSEQAAVLEANKLGIPTMSMVDLFGLLNLHKLEADYVTVLSQRVIDNIKNDTGVHPGQEFLITGNPAFDQAFDYRGPIDHAWRKQHLPTLPEGAKTLLWIDDSGYFDKETGLSRTRSEQDIIRDLDTLAHTTKCNDGYLLIRPHPSQQRAPFDAWMQKMTHPHVLMAKDMPLYPLLNACDAVATYTSTVGCEALLMERPVIQLTYYPGKLNMWLGEWGLAHEIKTPAELPEAVRETFYGAAAQHLRARVAHEFPQEKAAPKIAEVIHKIVSQKDRSKQAALL